VAGSTLLLPAGGRIPVPAYLRRTGVQLALLALALAVATSTHGADEPAGTGLAVVVPATTPEGMADAAGLALPMTATVIVMDAGIAIGEPGSPEPTDLLVTSHHGLAFRQRLMSFVASGQRTAARLSEVLRSELRPGFQFDMDPERDEIVIGWRFAF
jgi:hypothetical protein